MKKKYIVTCSAILPVKLSKTILAESEELALQHFKEILNQWESTPEKYLPDCDCQDYRVDEERDSAEFEVEEDTSVVCPYCGQDDWRKVIGTTFKCLQCKKEFDGWTNKKE